MAYKVVIIGSGPAGYTAALYSARSDMAPVLYEGLQPGGQLTITTDVENYPGFPEGIMGPELMEHMKAQAARFGTDIRPGFIQSVDFSKRPFVLNDGTEELEAESVIVSTGASARLLGVEAGALVEGYEADIALIDPDKPWVVDSGKMKATAGNTPFDGQPTQGRVTALFKGGMRIGG